MLEVVDHAMNGFLVEAQLIDEGEVVQLDVRRHLVSSAYSLQAVLERVGSLCGGVAISGFGVHVGRLFAAVAVEKVDKLFVFAFDSLVAGLESVVKMVHFFELLETRFEVRVTW